MEKQNDDPPEQQIRREGQPVNVIPAEVVSPFEPVKAGDAGNLEDGVNPNDQSHRGVKIVCPVLAGGTGDDRPFNAAMSSNDLFAVEGIGGQATKSAENNPNNSPGICRDDSRFFEFCETFEVLRDALCVNRVANTPVHKFCRDIISCEQSCLQLGIGLAQLLLSHPRDGVFIRDFFKQVWTPKTDSPIRRDLLPFQWVPSVGAALKLLQLLKSRNNGVLEVTRSAFSHLPRQQRKKLVDEGCMQLWRFMIICVLNGEYCDWNIPPKLAPSQPGLGQKAALEFITTHVRRFIQDPITSKNLPNYDSLMQSKTFDYGGDEVSYALPLRLEELLPGLPDASVGGSLQAVNVADTEVRRWLENPELTLKPSNLWPSKVPQARINSTRQEWYRIVECLFQRNILEPIPESEIFCVGNTKVLNGAFAVGKSGSHAAGEKRITRLIMNFVPSNTFQMLMRGDLQTLSASSNWASLVLPPNHTVLWSSEDQRGAFYAWCLPRAWRKYMCFRWPVPGELVGCPELKMAYVCSRVIPMGWINAVGLFQHLHRRLGLADPPIGAGFPAGAEWRRDRPNPQGSKTKELTWVQYYLDDFDNPEIIESSRAGAAGQTFQLTGSTA